jgi:cytochrome c-type biogenesis protein CcmF
MAGSGGWTTERIELMRPGDTIDLAGYAVAFDGAERVTGPNYTADRGRFVVSRDGTPVYEMTPEKRWYPVAGMPTTEAAIRTTWFYDLYIVLGEPREDGGWSVRAYHRPLVPWIWLGSVVMTLGGAISLADRRLRVGAPARRRAADGAAPQPAE